MTNEFQQPLPLILSKVKGGWGFGAWAEAMTCGNKHVMNPDQRQASLGHSGTLKMEEIKEV